MDLRPQEVKTDRNRHMEGKLGRDGGAHVA